MPSVDRSPQSFELADKIW